MIQLNARTLLFPSSSCALQEHRTGFFKARLGESKINGILSLDQVLANKQHGCDYRLTRTGLAEAQSMSRKANFERKPLRRKEGMKVLTYNP